MEKIILVTGGSGFIGSCLVRHLNTLGKDRIVIVDNLRDGDKWKNMVGKRFLDVIHKNDLFTWLIGKEKEIEAIIHLGACSSTVETDCNYLLENNYRYSVKLADFAIKNGIRFIYASSAATYGNGVLGFSDDHANLEKFMPLNMYGYSKHLFDLWLKRRDLLNKVVGLKFFNVFGPNEYHKGRMSSAIIKMVPETLKKGSISLFKSNDPAIKDGEQVRDFIYVKDVVMMTAAFLENDFTGIYNIGCGVANSWKDLAKAVMKALDAPLRIEYNEMPADLQGKYQNYTKADMDKWEKAGLPFPKYSLEDAVKDYICNYLLKLNYY
jgi:ADP-L-glycero-D-manno-heptose 6-epimerase